MITIETKRLIGKSDLEVVDGRVAFLEKNRNNFNLLSMKPATGMEQGFVFYLLEQPDELVCHIGITCARNRFEITYGTETKMRNSGYMTEAVAGFLEWLFTQTEVNKVWGFVPINNEPSKSVLLNNSFIADEIEGSTQWFIRHRGEKNG